MLVGVAVQIQVRIDDRDVRRGLAALGPRMGAALAKALNRTAFDVLDAERAEAQRAFPKASLRGKQLVSGRGSFRFDAARANALAVHIRPNENVPRRLEILEEHERGGIITAGAGVPRLAVSSLLAVPINEARASRRSRGVVSKRFQLSTIFGEKGRGFRAGNVVLERVGVSRRERKAAGHLFGNRTQAAVHGFGRSRARALYVLVPQADLPDRFRWYETAQRVAVATFPRKAAEELDKFRAK